MHPLLLHSGLCDPHSLVSHDGSLYFCEARARRVCRDGETIAEYDRGYVRGILLEDQFVWIGVSTSRHSPDTMEHAEARRLSRKHVEPALRGDVPAREIYGFLHGYE